MGPSTIIGGHRVSEQVLGAVREASRRTGADFGYMLANAARESGFRADAQAETSSATGLYQFIDSTWLQMVRDHGAEHGLGGLASQIVDGPDGTPVVADPATRQRILDLRRDPRLNAVMAGEFAIANRRHLERTVGGDIGATELYLAHFLGAKAAETFLEARRATPERAAAELFPAAARANRAVFFDHETGAPRSLEAVYQRIDRTFDDTLASARSIAGPADRPPPTFAAPANSAMPHLTQATGLSLWSMLFLNSLPVPGASR